ncbi:MAG TPA: hypothetical protein VMW22_06900 [Candidatus Desulfaltia sp.]|nr:hypothetical protein [Candidatus Desulfaltia sp.]
MEGLATLAEYTSREARYRLVQICLEEIQGRLAEEEKSPDEASKVLAARLMVSQRTIQRWASGGIQSCNGNADALIIQAIKSQPHKAAKILKRDLDTHRKMLVTTLIRAIMAGDLKPEAEI